MRRLVVLSSALILAAARPIKIDVAMSATPVADAAQEGDVESVRDLLKDGVDVNAAQGDGMTALHWAALSNDVDLAETLLYAGANVQAATRLGTYTPLVLAARSGSSAIVEKLLAAGADANDATSSGATALMLAARSGSADAVRLLLDHGADVNARELGGGETALMFAAANNRRAVIDLLVDHGGDPAVTTDIVDVPTLNKALDDDFRKRLADLKKELAERAREGGESESKDRGRNLFAKLFGWMIPGKGEPKKPRRKRESFGVRVGVQGGMTALLLAARQGHIESADALVDAGADINQVAEGSKTSPLLIATMNGHFDLAKHLLDRGADPALAAEPSRVTPLYAAINLAWAPRAAYPQPTEQKQQALTHLDLMKALLEAGADPNVRLTKKVWFMGYNFDRSSIDEIGATPFWRAAYGSDVAAMKLLRAHGAEPNIPTIKGKERPPVAAQAARKRKYVSKKKPVPVGGPSMTPLHAAAGAGYGEGFAANDHRNHPAGFMPAVKYLVEECGADVNAQDADGSTPLHNAAARGDVAMIQYLVSKGADVTILNFEGQSTADMANGPVQRVQPFPEARDLLVSLGAVNHDQCVSC